MIGLDWNDEKRATGRTSRMLRHAIENARRGEHTMVLAADARHVDTLGNMLEGLLRTDDALHGWINILIFREHYPDPPSGRKVRYYDYEKGAFRNTISTTHYLIDHYTLSHRINKVLQYLDSTRDIENVPMWLADTAKTLTSQGRKVYVIADDPQTVAKLEASFIGFPQRIQIEDGTMMGNLNWAAMKLERAHPNCHLLFDPMMLRRHYAGAIKEITRWDNE